MSASAEKWNPETGKWELVYAVNLDTPDRKHQYRCASCHASASLAICSDKDNYFLSHEHTVDCPVGRGHKLLRITTRTEIDLDAILEYEDHDPTPGYTPPEGEAEGGELNLDDQDDPNADLRLDPDATRTVRSASGMYRELMERHGGDSVDSFANRQVDSIFFRRDTFRKFKADWGSPQKLVVTKRCSPKNLKHKIPAPNGYVILRDAYSHEDEDAIYFLVKMHHPEHDRRFKDRLFGHTERNEAGDEIRGVGRDPHRNIVIFATWNKFPHSHYQIYRAELNSRMVAFVNAPDAT